jgi:adenylate cyclase
MSAVLPLPTSFSAAPPAGQVALPVRSGGQLLGLLFVDGQRAQGAAQAEAVWAQLEAHFRAALRAVHGTEAANQPVPAPDAGAPLQVRLYARDSSVFVNGHYLIKGVAGALLWKMLRDWQGEGRSLFCYQELRRDPALKLPDLVDNLGARLILLQKRLAQKCPQLRIEKVKRGLFRFDVRQPVTLVEA